MFERFTERARQVVVLAQEVARELNHNYIATEHVVAGLYRESEGLAHRVMREDLGLSEEYLIGQIVEIVGTGDAPVGGGQIPFTPRAKKCLELSLREALSLGHNYIGTEHLLLGVVREGGGLGIKMLGGDPELVRNTIIRRLSEPRTERAKLERRLREAREQKDKAIEAQQYDDAKAWRDRERLTEDVLREKGWAGGTRDLVSQRQARPSKPRTRLTSTAERKRLVEQLQANAKALCDIMNELEDGEVNWRVVRFDE